jgi:hypothetical protein
VSYLPASSTPGWSGYGYGPSSYAPSRSDDHTIPIVVIVIVAVAVVVPTLFSLALFGIANECCATGPGSIPIGTAVAFGSPEGSACRSVEAEAGICVTSGNWIYEFLITQSSLDLSDVLFEVETTPGPIFDNSGTASFAVLNFTGSVVASTELNPGGLVMITSWTHYQNGYTADSGLLSGFTIAIDTGQSAPTTGQGLFVVGVGASGFTGTTSPLALP